MMEMKGMLRPSSYIKGTRVYKDSIQLQVQMHHIIKKLNMFESLNTP